MAVGRAGVTTRAQSAGPRQVAVATERAGRAGTTPADPPAPCVTQRRAASPSSTAMSSALDTFAHLELASDDTFDCDPAWFSDDDECLDDDEDFLDDDEDEGVLRALRTPQLPHSGFMSLAEYSTPSSGLTDALSSESCASPNELGDFAQRIFAGASPPQAPVKRERDPSPIVGGEVIAAALPVAAMEAVDIDGHAPMSLDQYECGSLLKPSAIPITTAQIFGTRGKAPKKPKDASAASVDNSDAQSCASSSSGVSTCTNASFATTISGGSCYGFVPYVPALAFPPPIWRCRDCNIIHPTDYKVCGKCCKKREEIGQDPVPAGDPNASSDHQAAAAAAMEAAAAWYSTQLAQACPPQGLYAAHAFSPTCGGGGMRPPYALQSPAAGARSKQSRNATRRGENVKDNPQMQKTAREGQKHWHDKVQQMRVDYEAAKTSMARPQFAEQRYFCSARNLKCQKESLLIFLQTATQQNLILPLPFVHPADELSGFLGWTGFQILPGCGDKFRAGVEALFPEPPKLNTLYHLFRRAGLVPEDWRRAWDGEVPFSWNPNRCVS